MDTGDGYSRTDAAKELGTRFEEIMVDEYQDTNEAQDLIFRAISRDETNLFLVGDVKQSIYRFRQAMPQLFLRRRESYPPYDRKKANFPACVVLDRNFRSRPGVTGCVNFVFRQLMSRQTGEMDYTKEEELVAAADYPVSREPEAQLDIVDLSGMGDDAGMIHAESLHIAELVVSLTDGTRRVLDHGKLRPVVYRDCCILLRSANRYAHEYARELTALGVPAWADTAGGFFAACEVGVALSLLQVIDNPMQDIPLLSVMMSPIYGFTPDEISEVRLCSRTGRLYPAVVEAAKRGVGRSGEFLRNMEEYRTLAATQPVDRLIRLVFEKTGFPDLVRAMSNGELRLANLRMLLGYAEKYESSGYTGLSGFLRFLERLRKSGADLSAASALSESANVVRIMSIHHSKGLEFPVCILAGCSRNFHKERGEVLLHPELGLGARLRDPETGVRYTTLPRDAVALELERDEMSEELRVLYVAMTRAKERLILVTSLKNPARTLGKLATRITEEERIQPYAVRSVSSISDWLLLCALRHPDGRALRELAGAPEEIAVSCETPWKIRIVTPVPKVQEEEKTVPAAQPDPALRSRISRRLNFVYPYSALNGVCAKVAASELAAKQTALSFSASSRPAFLSESGLTPAERGTALHAYLQFADYRKAAADPAAERDRMVRQGFLTGQQAAALDLNRVSLFLASPIAARMLVSDRMEREYRFSVGIPASRVDPGLTGAAGEEQVVLQGAVDCVFREGVDLVIVDYKTDRMKNPAELWLRYRSQLALYRYALEKCTGFSVKQCLLYSFYWNREITEDEK